MGQAYNIVNEKNTMMIRDMADLVARKLAGGRIKIVYDIPESVLVYGYAPEVQMRLSSRKLRNLGWYPEVELVDMYKKMIRFWGYKI